jgi:serine/threonine protein kinase
MNNVRKVSVTQKSSRRSANDTVKQNAPVKSSKTVKLSKTVKTSNRNKMISSDKKHNMSKNNNTKLSSNKVGEDYPLDKLIGKGSFGYVYKGKHRVTGEYFACKAEKKSMSNKERLRAEYNLYKTFRKKKVECVPHVDTYLTTKEWNLMMMQLLGQSLDKVFTNNDSKLDLGTVMKIGLQMIDGLEEIHNTGVIHRDIKPNNFMFGRKEIEEDAKLYIVDFGLSKLWKDNRTGMHISQKSGRSMIGTARYASIHIHLGIEPTRRDDLESMGYVLVYLAKGRLPWQGLAKKKKGSAVDEIKDKKMSTTTEDLCTGLPTCFKSVIDYAKSLSFQEKPNYDLMRQMIVKSAKKDDIEIVLAWEDEECE